MKKQTKGEPVRHYRMTYTCYNCGKTFVEEFEFGQYASRGECPHCGCEPKVPNWIKTSEGY
jgi:DNA-directed RNA polymerase subunit RPC12/RpoP